MPETTLTAKSVRITEDEAKWLSAAATKGAVTQNDLLRLALHRLRKDLGAASRIKPETVFATAKASKYKLTPPRATASKPVSPATEPQARPAAQRRRRRRGPSTLAPSVRAPTEHGVRSASRRSRWRSARAAAGRRAHDRLTTRRRQLCCAFVDLEPPGTKPRRTRE